MPELLDRLKTALADRYAIQEEIGAGGMAIVYLAEDLKHHRKVAVKVLRSDIASSLGADRFLREIGITANLSHPHILPLLDSGNANGFLYYVMPYREGGSLRDRLDREKQLPLDEAIHIAKEVADALSYAHGQGVIHRDIKPENIMLEAGHAIVADFGIARAVSSAGGEKLTETGLAIGTPTYMSPEQAGGEKQLDGRSDIYALACTLYEMLAGSPPFTGPTAQAIIARHMSSTPPSMRVVRDTIPIAVENAVAKALAKVPADRYATAGRFGEALLKAGDSDAGAPSDGVTLRRAVAGILALVAAATLFIWTGSRDGADADTDPGLVAVMPFSVSASDETLDYLRDGMVDLLAARLTGEAGPRAIEPRPLLSRWRSAAENDEADVADDIALDIARSLRAGQVITGGIVDTPGGLVIRATLRDVPDGRSLATARVVGPSDSLTLLVDQLVAQLLALASGESTDRLAALTSTSLDALRAYIDGRARYRSGAYEDAVNSFQRALTIDSSFALAAIALRNAAGWTPFAQDAMARGIALAWASRDRLSARDRVYLAALAGPHYPNPSPFADLLSAWNDAVQATPDRAEAWWELGEILFHFGPLINADASLQRAAVAFSRAFDLDSTFLPSIEHLYDIANIEQDTSQVRRLGEFYLAHGAGGRPEVVEWQKALALGDDAGLQAARAKIDSAGPDVLALVIFFSQIAEVWTGGLDDADRALATLLGQAGTENERWITLAMQHNLALNRGRPQAALRITESLQRLRPPLRFHLRSRILDALYWDGDSTAGVNAAHEITTYADAPPSDDAEQRWIQQEDICALEQWRLWNGSTTTAGRAITRLRTEDDDRPPPITLRDAVCADVLEALLQHIEGSAEAGRSLDRLDSLLRTGPLVESLQEANLTVARLRELQGEPEAALMAVQRRTAIPGGEKYLSTFLREEGRLAALVGNDAAAIRAYAHYVGLRSDPEPGLHSEVDQIRDELARLRSLAR